MSPPFTIAETAWIGATPWSWKATGLVAAAAILPGALSYSAYCSCSASSGAARTGLMLYLAPLYAALLAWRCSASRRAPTT